MTLLGLCVLLPCRALADTRQIGKLTREQFALAMHLIQQKVIYGVDPPQSLTADMIPPTERGTPITVGPTDKFYIFIIGLDWAVHTFSIIPLNKMWDQPPGNASLRSTSHTVPCFILDAKRTQITFYDSHIADWLMFSLQTCNTYFRLLVSVSRSRQ